MITRSYRRERYLRDTPLFSAAQPAGRGTLHGQTTGGGALFYLNTEGVPARGCCSRRVTFLFDHKIRTSTREVGAVDRWCVDGTAGRGAGRSGAVGQDEGGLPLDYVVGVPPEFPPE